VPGIAGFEMDLDGRAECLVERCGALKHVHKESSSALSAKVYPPPPVAFVVAGLRAIGTGYALV
jgi:hypothetical protein